MEELIGQLISHYKVIGVLGSGGMGSVLKAHDLSLDRDVAIKMLHPHLAEQSGFRERFLAEARVAARLSHLGIVQVYDFGQYRSYLYIVMQFIEGPNLRQLLDELCSKNQWIRLDETVQLISQVARALHYAHEKGILHRDIKPGNIMLKKEPGGTIEYQAVLTDLGLARLMTGEHFTLTGTTLGTPPYMSPEQAQGLEVDPRSDVYSLGILLFELAVGRLPFPIHSITDAIRYHTKEPPPLPRSIRPDLPLAIEQIILKAIQKKPEDRYSSAIELAKSLDAIAIEATTVDTAPTIREDDKTAQAVSLITQLQTSKIEPRGASILAEFPNVVSEATDRIQIVEQGKEAYSVKLDRKGMTLGRGSECDIQVSDPKVSSKHLRIEWDGQAYQVIDLQSKNGSFLANVRLLDQVPQKWDAGQALHIGDVWIRLIPAAKRTDTVTSTDLVHTCSTDGALGVRIEPEQVAVEPGSVVTIQVSIWNQSSTVNHYEISVQGIPSSWLAAPPPEVMLMDGEQKAIELLICPPRQPESRAGRDPITVRVKKREQGERTQDPKTAEQFVEVYANLTVGAYWQFSSEMQPQRVKAGHPARVTIHNQGNTKENFSITWEDREEALDFDPSEKQMQIPEGKAAMVEFTARPRQQRWIGGEKSHSFTAQVSHPRRGRQALSGEMISRAFIPGWLPPIAMFLCLLMIAGRTILSQIIFPTPIPTLPGKPVIDEWCIYPTDNPPGTFSNCPIQIKINQEESIIIRWSVSNATSVKISPVGGTQLKFSDQLLFSPQQDVRITLEVSNGDNLIQKPIDVIVVPLTSTPTYTPTITQTTTPDLAATSTCLAQTHIAETADAGTATALAIAATETLLASDYDGDGLTYLEELKKNTLPNESDTDKDCINDFDDSLPIQPQITSCTLGKLEVIKEFKGHDGAIVSLIFSPNGEFLASGSADKIAIIWDVPSWTMGWNIVDYDGVASREDSITFSKDSSYVAVLMQNSNHKEFVGIGRLTDSQWGLLPLIETESNDHNWALAFSPTNANLLFVIRNSTISSWTVIGNGMIVNESRELPSQQSALLSIAISKSGKYIVGGNEIEFLCRNECPLSSTINIIDIWETSISNFYGSLVDITDNASSIAFSPIDETLLASGSKLSWKPSSLRLWRITDRTIIWFFREDASGISFSQDGKLLVYATKDNVYIRSVENGELLKAIPNIGITQLALSPDGTTLVTGTSNGLISVWQVKQ